MDSLQKISNDLVDSINEKEKKKPIPYDTYAKVLRIDGGTAWVHIPGGVDETPVALTVNAKAGDSVLVRVSGGNAWIVGNSSAPPTDDTKAVEAKGVADVAQETAESAEEVAKNASRAVKSTSQYFWHTETDTGAGAGAHITEVPQEDFIADPANGGGNLLAQSRGIKVRNGLTELAIFGADYTQLGQLGKSRMRIYPRKLILLAPNNAELMNIGGIEDTDGYVHHSYRGDGSKTVFELKCRPKKYTDNSGLFEVTIDNTPNSNWTLIYDDYTALFSIKFTTAPANNSIIRVWFEPYFDAVLEQQYVLGYRDPNRPAIGHFSFSSGYATSAQGHYSATFGLGTVANGGSQTVIGSYNAIDVKQLFIIGNGQQESDRSNAFTVDWDGNVKAAGSITASGHATAIGYKTGRQTGTYSLASGKSFVTVPASALSRITLGEGTWIIHAHAAFESNNTGRRAMRIYDTTTSEGLTRSFVNQPATNGAATNMQTMAIVSLEESNTFTLQLAQNSGAAKSVDLVLEAVRIA